MRHSVLIPLVLVLGCGETPPPCSNNGDARSAPSAGCLVADHRGALLVQDWAGDWALPGGGVKPGESASCGAEREVFEETGIPVVATQLVTVFDNGFHLYWCHSGPNAAPRIHRPLEVREVAWQQPAGMNDEQWRYPGQGALIVELLSKTEFDFQD
ncbi:MAG: NUDIX hydrolase [Halieaceae bacterium]